MTQEEKELLVKDLCGRLPYMLFVQWMDGTIEDISKRLHCLPTAILTNSKMFLRPMSSMTEEERVEYNIIKCSICPEDADDYAGLIDWLNAHHFDYRGLIEKGLDLEAPEGMYEQNSTE